MLRSVGALARKPAFQARQGPPRHRGPPRQGLQAGARRQGPLSWDLSSRGLPGRGLPGTPRRAGRGLSGKPGRGLPGRGRPGGLPGRGLPAGGCDVLPEGLGYLLLGRPDGFLASDLPGPPRSPQLRDCSSVARRRASGSGAASPAGFGAFALLDGPGLTQFRV